ncbi:MULTISPECIES: indolepyruvate oxidoreductase subunit beta [unclassified Clostridium]|jgi:indolepyruvate ferredoxin oxidoreductase beta subunit|uniref:indolepyruvate oxidoreductase subunit beta n=1 Tax=Clostridia TaxID=186801 RepID=UPI001106731E|nr:MULTISPECIES: indolepyruvate oxidoreductase subunit beta [unclassified Clostridium]
MKNLDILIVGVGGQGTLLASRILGQLALQMGMDAKVSEVHGMAQRGGSVVTYVRMGENIASPMIEEGGADYILAMEKLEAARWLNHLKKDGALVVNDQEIAPMPVIMGKMAYPEGLEEQFAAYGVKVTKVDAFKIAVELGNQRAFNCVLMGVLARSMPFAKEEWLKAVEVCVPPKTIALNQQAFLKGYELGV